MDIDSERVTLAMSCFHHLITSPLWTTYR
jgi:hypothetical protein